MFRIGTSMKTERLLGNGYVANWYSVSVWGGWNVLMSIVLMVA